MTAPALPENEAVRHPLPAELIHDLRTPLTHVLGYSEMLIERALEAGDDRYLADLRKVNAAGCRLLALMEEHFQPVRPPDAPPAAAAPEPGPEA